MKAFFTIRELKRYYLSLLAMRGLNWVLLAGCFWLGVLLLACYARLPRLFVYLVTSLTGLWEVLGWFLLGLLVLLLVMVGFFRRLHPGLIKYIYSSWSTAEFLGWLREGVAVASEDGSVKVQSTKPLEGCIVYLSGGVVLVVVFVPKGLGGKALADGSTDAIKEYADGVLPGMKSGSVQHTAGARYWIYRRSDV